MCHKIILTLFTLVSVFVAQAQTNTRFSQFHVVKGLTNPGAIGHEARISAELIYRNQWTGQPGSPSTLGFAGGYEITPDHAIGINVMNDQLGVAKTTGINLGYAYRLYINDEQRVGFGLTAGVENINNDYSRVFLINQNDQTFMQSYNLWRFNAGVGVFYSGPKMYIGYSLPSLLNNTPTTDESGIKPKYWHHYLITGFYFSNKTGSYTFNPCVQVKFLPNSPIQGDLLLRNIIKGKFAFSLGYRTENAILAGFEIMFNNVARLGYSFNYNLSRYNNLMATSHEIYLGLGLPFYYETNKFGSRHYLNKKNNFTNHYKTRAKKLGKRRHLRYR